MYDIERRNKILEILHTKKSCSVADLARQLSFSEATIRRDLNALEKEMKLRKTFGGAVILEQYPSEVPINVRQIANVSAKQHICRAASRLIHDNMTIFLAASTTVDYLLPYLCQHRGLTVITNCPHIPTRLCNSDINVYCTGGKLLHHSNAYVGEFAKHMLRSINADLMFFSARGISLDGRVTNSSTDDDIHHAMMESAAKICLLADSSKIGKIYPFTICRLDRIDTVITDNPLPEGLEHRNLIIADH